MEYQIIEDKKDLLKLSFKDIDQGFMTLVKDKIWEDKATELAGFKVTHPEVGELVFTLRTKGKAPKKVWNDALAALTKDITGFEKEIKKIK
jgi:DNA-directed RNA polymerase subunit L